MDSEPITLADRYVLESTVARGGMATVYKARDEVLARTVAVKVLHPHLVEDAAFINRFRLEALAAARLAHPNIVSIYDTGAEEDNDGGDRHFIVMEFCSEGSLSDHLEHEGRLDVDRVCSIGVAVCGALGYAHRSGVVHRDIKPANVLVTADGSLKVADFGIAKAAFGVGDITTTGAILGTVSYLSPEQLQGAEPDQRSDLYSLGVTLYELLAGRPPFGEETQVATAVRHLRDQPPDLRSLRAGIPRSLESVVMKALAKDPAERYESADEMASALNGTSPSGATSPMMRVSTPVVRSPRRQSTPPQSSRPLSAARRLMPVLILIAVAAMTALAITAFVAANRDDDRSGQGGGNGGGPGRQGGEGAPIDVSAVTDLDPAGDGEHPEEAPAAADGNESTAWSTQSYSVSLQDLGKSGVGLVFDLGEATEVVEATVLGCDGCEIELRASDKTSADDESGFELLAESTASAEETFSLDDAARFRYWLVFITSLPGGGGGSASLSEVTFVGP